MLIPGKIVVLAFSAEGDTKALSVTQHHEMPITALDKLMRGRFFRDKELEQPVGEFGTFANRTRQQMLARFGQLIRAGTIAKWQDKKEKATTEATSRAFVIDGMDEGMVVSTPEECNLRKKAGTRGT